MRMPNRSRLMGMTSMFCHVATLLFATEGVSQGRAVTPRDVIVLPAIVEVQLAPEGRRVAYAIRTRYLAADAEQRSFWLWSEGGTIDSLGLDRRASQLRWRTDAVLSYLAPDSGGITQVWQYALGVGAKKLTTHSVPVISYEWSPDGRRVAFTASHVLQGVGVSDGAGVVIDNERFFYTRLFAKEPLVQRDSHYGDPPARTELWIHDVQMANATLVSDWLSVSSYAWSPDGRALAMTGHGELGRLPSHLAQHDLVLYGLDSDTLEVLEAGSGGDYLDTTVVYDQPFWSPDGTRIGYFREDMRDRWAASGQLGIFSLAEHRTVFLLSDERWETYNPRGFWLHPDTVLIENTYRAGRRLFAVAVAEDSVIPVPVVDSEDWFAQHSFSRDGRIAAFVRERIDTPPDLYISDRGMSEVRRLTDLHVALDDVMPPRVERLHWAGEDGVEVEGWLYVPEGKPPFPTVVFVHGGPTWVFPNRYEPYVHAWPYAFGVYAARGLAVFVPNYRGTGSYGKAFRRRSALDREPIGDIIAGVDMLVGRGIADPSRLGIAGHSHGCWLGPLVAVRHRRFVAGACAAGTANWAATYGRNAGWMNSEIVEYYWGGGASPYEEPDRYRNLSPVFGFEGLRTPFLFEYGALAGAVSGMEYATAAWRAGVPHEFVIYRDTGHNVTKPRIMLEAMERNLEWFEFWLLDRQEATKATKRVQYERWRKLRERIGRGTG